MRFFRAGPIEIPKNSWSASRCFTGSAGICPESHNASDGCATPVAFEIARIDQPLLEEERQRFLRPLPKQSFEACRLGQANADSLSLVRFDTNSYSVPTKYAHRQITIVATIDEVRFIFEDRLIARHERYWGKQQCFFDPVHYLALLERKPGGFDHARPLEDWELPVCFGILRRRLEATL